MKSAFTNNMHMNQKQPFVGDDQFTNNCILFQAMATMLNQHTKSEGTNQKCVWVEISMNLL